jgi:hypothetical protein
MIRHSRLVVLTLLAFAVTVAAWVASDRPAKAGPAEYVKICDAYGAGYFYIPGSDICQNANAIPQAQSAISGFATTAYQGIAISSAIVAPFMPSTANYAVSAHLATFYGQEALGVGGLARAGNTNFFLSGGIGIATAGGSPVGRAGFMYAW